MESSNDCFSSPEDLLLPIINLSPFFSSKMENAFEKKKCGAEIFNAFSQFGGCYITGFENCVQTMFPPNSKDDSKLSDIHLACKTLFSLSSKDKKQIPVIQPGGFTRGYIPIGGESGSYKFEKKEAFSYGENRDILISPSQNALQGANSWPSEEIIQRKLNPGWKSTLVNFYDEICTVSEGVVKAMSLSLGYDENYLGGYCEESRSISLMRLFHYLALNPKEMTKEGIIGSSEHTDWGFLTLILQPMTMDSDKGKETSNGLQFFYEGVWRDIPALPNTLVLNCGDYVSLITNGEYKSPLHRVFSSDADRISTVFFLYPSFHAKIPRCESLAGDKLKLSLFENQNESKLNKRDDSSENMQSLDISFGSYILNKWDQVFRA